MGKDWKETEMAQLLEAFVKLAPELPAHIQGQISELTVADGNKRLAEAREAQFKLLAAFGVAMTECYGMTQIIEGVEAHLKAIKSADVVQLH